jgi:hypothetical protein
MRRTEKKKKEGASQAHAYLGGRLADLGGQRHDNGVVEERRVARLQSKSTKRGRQNKGG